MTIVLVTRTQDPDNPSKHVVQAMSLDEDEALLIDRDTEIIYVTEVDGTIDEPQHP